MLRRSFERYSSLSARLPLFEKCGFHLCVATTIGGAVKTEIGNPIMGGIYAIVGTLLIAASLNTTESLEALDNGGDDLV